MYRSWDTVLDRWANFDFKPMYKGMIAPIEPVLWLDYEDQRRLRAYGMLEAYVKNKARIWIGTVMDPDNKETDARREYGDASLLVKTALSSLMGDQWEIVTEGAQQGGDPAAIAQQRFVEEWADSEKFSLKLIESETQSIKFGDSIYTLGWDTQKARVRLNVYDPGFYFPQFDSRAGGGEDFPNEVFIAWEFEEEGEITGRTETYVRKVEWYLDTEEEPATCFYRDAVWDFSDAVDNFRGTPVDILSEGELADDEGWIDLGVDFIPVVHVPNTVSLQDHFGESILSDVLQILDDVQSTDTDLQAAAATTGSPPIAVTGMAGEESQTSYGPGTVIRTGDGTATLLDTSKSLDALMKLKDALLERLAVNSRTPESLLGRVKPNEVPSGIALTLSFTPHSGMVKQMRLVRDYKYRLLFSFMLRLSMVNGALPKRKDLAQTRLQFGSFLPADMQEAMQIVTQLLEAKAISLETAVEILIEKGYPVEDYVLEIERITQRDYDAAQSVLTITGNAELAAERLGIDPKDVLGFEDDEVDDPFPDDEDPDVA